MSRITVAVYFILRSLLVDLKVSGNFSVLLYKFSNFLVASDLLYQRPRVLPLPVSVKLPVGSCIVSAVGSTNGFVSKFKVAECIVG